MATYHCSVKVGSAGKGAAHDEYLRREGKYQNSARYEDLEAAGYGNLPPWAAHNPSHFWQAADQLERKNGYAYREFEVALPRELNPAQRRALVQDFIQQEIGNRHAYTYAIHTPKAALEKGEQPHAHIMYSERTRDGIERDPEQYFKRANKKNPALGGCAKSDRFTGGKTAEQAREAVKALRAHWAELTNAYLEHNGHASRVDHRSLKEQGIAREPEKHLGGVSVRQLSRLDISALLERRAAEGERERSQKEASVIDLSGDLEKARREADRKGLDRPGPAIRSARFDVQRQQAERKQREARKKAELDARQQAQREKEAQEKAWAQQQQRIERMTSAELRFEIQRLQPQNVQAMAARQPEVSAAWGIHRQQEAQWNQANDAARQAGREMAYWRAAHPLQAKAHDVGLKKASYLSEREQLKADNEQSVLQLGPRLEDSHRYARSVQSGAELDVINEQAPLRQRLDYMERLQQHKAAQEREQQRQEWAVNDALKTFKGHAVSRELKAYGYNDTGKHWQAMPEPMKKMIEDYNRLTERERPIVLERLRENLKRDPEMVARMNRQFEQAREQEHDHSPGR